MPTLTPRWLVGLSLTAAVVALAVPSRRAFADGDDGGSAKERCATRLSIALLGASPAQDLLAAAQPQSRVPAMLAAEAFRERFARFLNATLSSGPGSKASEDAPYFLAKALLEKDAPWRDLFVGPYRVVADGAGARVEDDPDGLGFFRSPDWLLRYAGNEVNGLKIATAYRILNNVTGVEITAVTTPPGTDTTAAGRAAPGCRGCHFESWYALDRVAGVLTRKKEENGTVTFTPPPWPPEMLFGATVKDDGDLVRALVASKDFSFRTCRLAFEFLYGRSENTCEADVFDGCMKAFASEGKLTAAVGAIARHPSFCAGGGA